MKKPLVSILMPFRDAGPWLDECLASITGQEFKEWELIAVDDHSTDDSLAMMLAYASEDDRITVMKNSGNGIIDALRTAHRLKSGEFVTRMDADDIMPPGKLQMLYSLASADPGAVATGKVKYFSKQGISPGYREYEHWINERCSHDDHWHWVYRECVVCSANWMTHASNVDFETLEYPEDYALVFDWYSRSLRITATDQLTHLWREHSQRTSRNSIHYVQEAFFQLKLERFLRLDHDPGRTLVLVGNNRKTKLAGALFKQHHISFQAATHEDMGVLDKENLQVLVGVFPNLTERQAIQALLGQKRLVMGTDWWWL